VNPIHLPAIGGRLGRLIYNLFDYEIEEALVLPILNMCKPWHRITSEDNITELDRYVRSKHLRVDFAATCHIEMMPDRILLVAQIEMSNAPWSKLIQPVFTPF
jgi:hypothetical protein